MGKHHHHHHDKDEKKKSHKSHHSHHKKHHKSDRSEKSSSEKSEVKMKNERQDLEGIPRNRGEAALAKESSTLSTEDYFLKNEEYRVWLKLEKQIDFEALSSDDSHKLFEEFVKLFNRKKLSEMYYEGIPPDVRSSCLKSRHRWNIKIDREERNLVTQLSDDVDRITRSESKNIWPDHPHHLKPPSAM